MGNHNLIRCLHSHSFDSFDAYDLNGVPDREGSPVDRVLAIGDENDMFFTVMVVVVSNCKLVLPLHLELAPAIAEGLLLLHAD